MAIFQKQNLVLFVLAMSLLTLFLGIAGCSGEDADKMFRQGVDAMAADNPDEAVIWFKKALQQNPEMAMAHYKLGTIYRKRGDAKSAYAEFTRAMQQDPKLNTVRKDLVFLLIENRALDQAVKVCKQYLEINGDDKDIYLILGNSLAYTKKNDQAVEVLTKGQKLYPEDIIFEMNLAKILVVKGDVEKGRSMLENLATREPDNIKVQITLAQMYEKLERYDLAVMTLEASMKRFPENPLPYLSLAQLYVKKNQLDSAKKIILDAETAGVKDSRLYRVYALLSHRQGKTNEALDFFKKSVEVATDETRILNLMILADYHTFLKNYKEAQKILETVIEGDASKKRLKSKVVELFMAQGEFDQARSTVESLLEENSEDARGHFLKGLMMMQDNDVVEARKEFFKAKELAPDVAENQFLYGMTFLNESEKISITEISEALKKNPKLFKARLALAELYARKGDLQQSLDELDKIISRQGDTNQLDKVTGKQVDNIKVRVLRIAVLMKMKKPGLALEDAKLLLMSKPDEPAYIFRVAEIYYAMKKFDDALPLYEKLQQEKPENIQLLNRIVGVFMLKKKYENAMAVVDSFLADYPESGAAIVVKARIYLSQGYVDLAENILIPEANKNENVAPIIMLAKLYRKNNDYENTVKYYLKALELFPDNLGIRMQLADFYLENKRNEEAIESYEDVLKLKEDLLPAMNNLAFLYTEENNNLDRALELANEVARKLPDDPNVVDTLGWVYVQKKAYSQAEIYLQKAITTKPDNPLISFHMATLRFRQGKQLEAEQLFQGAIKKGLSGRELTSAKDILSQITKLKDRLRAAKLAKDQGNFDQAIALFEDIQQNTGFNSEAAADLGMLYAEQDKDITIALDLAQKAYDTRPSSPLAADALGWVYYYQGSLLMAKQYVEQAIKIDEKYGPAHVHLGAVYLKRGELEPAKKELEIAKSMKLSTADHKQVERMLLELKNQ